MPTPFITADRAPFPLLFASWWLGRTSDNIILQRYGQSFPRDVQRVWRIVPDCGHGRPELHRKPFLVLTPSSTCMNDDVMGSWLAIFFQILSFDRITSMIPLADVCTLLLKRYLKTMLYEFSKKSSFFICQTDCTITNYSKNKSENFFLLSMTIVKLDRV